MKKTSLQIRNDIVRLQEQLRQAETREAERIGRIALKAGLGEHEIEDGELQAAFEELSNRFRGGQGFSTRGKKPFSGGTASAQSSTVTPSTTESKAAEA